MHILEVAVHADLHAHAHLVARLQRRLFRDGGEHFAALAQLHLIQLLLDAELLVLAVLHLVEVLQILPVEAAPRGAGGLLLNLHCAHIGGHFVAIPALLDVAGAGLCLLGAVALGVGPVAERQGHAVGVLQLRVVQQQGVNGLCGRFGGGPALRLLLLEQPQLHLLHRFRILGDGIERLDEQGLPLDGGLVPEVAVARLLPEHPHLFAVLGHTLDVGHYLPGQLRVAVAMADEGNHPLHIDGLALPVLLDIVVVVIVGFLMVDVYLLAQEEAAGVEVVDVAPGTGMLLLLPSLVVIVHLAVDVVDGPLEGGGFQLRLDAERVEVAAACHDVLGDVGAARAAREPRPAAVAVLPVFQFLAGVLALFGHTLQVKQQGDVLLACGFPLRVEHPRRLFYQDTLELLILLQLGTESIWTGVEPFIEHLLYARVAVHDVGGQGVGVIAAEDLLVALVGILHQIGHRLDGVPDGVGGELQR